MPISSAVSGEGQARGVFQGIAEAARALQRQPRRLSRGRVDSSSSGLTRCCQSRYYLRQMQSRSGELAMRPLPAVLLDLHEDIVTGRLTLRRGRVSKSVDLVNGNPVS